ncbi:MAG: LamG domain-containing protein [Bacteroidetes bacterium]|nr:LamG domain-containing protein [Bacteroidota bacterium]
MIFKNTITIFRKLTYTAALDYCLRFSGDGFIGLDPLTSSLNVNTDFSCELYFKVDITPVGGNQFLIANVIHPESNALAIAINNRNIIASFLTQEGRMEYIAAFKDINKWNHIRISRSDEIFECTYNGEAMSSNPEPVLSFSSSAGCRIACDTDNSNYFTGYIDNIYVTKNTEPLASYPLNEGSGETVIDQISGLNGVLVSAEWFLRQ